MTDKSDEQAPTIATTWLTAFSRALKEKDAQQVAELFLPDGWLRDALVFSWDYRSLEGHAKITGYLQEGDRLRSSQIQNVRLDKRPHLAPAKFADSPDVSGVELAFTFEAPAILGRGHARLMPGQDGQQSWKALSVYMMVDNLKGHEEADHELGVYDGHTKPWGEVKAKRRAAVENNPYVLIIGGGQCGLQTAARFQQMGLSTMVVERLPRLGDNWRRRYPTLSLHTPRTFVSFLYAPYPKSWPTFTPRDKLANWIEQYADTQDLVVWTSSYPLPGPHYDPISGRWTVSINKDGISVTVRPAHIVLATGTLGDPFTPTIPSRPSGSQFRGTIIHASAYMGAEPFAGKRVLVVGAGNTAADICQDLAASPTPAKSVTMLQRSSTCVISAALIAKGFAMGFPEGVDVDVSDFKSTAMPLGLLKKIASADSMREMVKGHDKEMLEGLTRSGLRLNEGPGGSGQRLLVWERLGGYWIDVGVAELIINGKVKVKSGVEVEHFKETGVVLTDGSELDLDVVIFATGYRNIRPSMEKIFGEDVIGKTKKVWGLDEEGEISGCYRPSGHTGLWYAAGDFYNARVQSKQLALLLKSVQLGMTSTVNLASVQPS